MHTFVFADLAGYTALTAAHGDDEAADAAAEFCEAVRQLLPGCDAEEVKAMGDALMLRAPDARQAAVLAERIVSGGGSRHRALGIRVGMHTGTAVRRGDDWFGAAVNIASRVADLACTGEILCSAATREAFGPAVAVKPRGEHHLKNVPEPLLVYELLVDSTDPLPVDPVCRMHVDPTLALDRREHQGTEYLFCSHRCAATFETAPDRYV
jgi:adenylate cyclase